MPLGDLDHIFKEQISNNNAAKLYFMLEDGDYKSVQRYDVSNIEELLPMLDSFYYAGSDNNMPRLIK